jgi:hypothetical protein
VIGESWFGGLANGWLMLSAWLVLVRLVLAFGSVLVRGFSWFWFGFGGWFWWCGFGGLNVYNSYDILVDWFRHWLLVG